VTRCLVWLGVMVAIWAIAAPTALANPLGAVEETAGSVVESTTPAEVTSPSPPAVDLPPAPQVSPAPTPTVSPPQTSSGGAAAVDDGVGQASSSAAELPSERGTSDVATPSAPDPASGPPRASAGGLGGVTPDARPGASPPVPPGTSSPSTQRDRRAFDVRSPIPRWLAYVWPAIALGPGRAIIGTLALFVGPGAGSPLGISAPLALLGLRDALRAQGAALAPAEAVAAADTKKPLKKKPLNAPFNDFGPGALKMLLFIATLLLLSYFVIRSEGGGAGGKQHPRG
jgi:hypothetical protein